MTKTIWSKSVKYYNSLMMMIVRWHCRNVKFSLFSLSMQRFINTNRESRNSTTWPRCVRRRKLEKESFIPGWSSAKKSGWNNLEQFPKLSICRSWFHLTRLTTLRRSRKLPKASTKGYNLQLITLEIIICGQSDDLISQNLTNFTNKNSV